ncbi:ApeA N-terminal domain-containing protein [Hyphomicrobium sp. 1Nfss2.1]|uniref:ApeA N-terminal domain 1-containing protein n=1 Tax=Hyphomicrobium sp. 1Nfss2.1 TaxID=3413936 RepID=UPI003C7E2DFA
MVEVADGKPVHCIELVTGKGLTGTLLVSEETICASIYSYTDFFYVKGEPIVLRSATNEIVSLHSNITSSPGDRSRLIDPKYTTYCQEILSNLAVVGHDPWTTEDRIRHVSFSVKHCTDLMSHLEKLKALGSNRYPTDDQLRIFSDTAGELTVKAGYAATYGMDFDSPTQFGPVFEIEFNRARDIRDYISSVSDYVSFLSFCLGAPLKPSSIHVDRLSSEEVKSAIEAHTYPGDHRVHYVWPEEEINTRDLWLGGSPSISRNDAELAALRACLVAWMNRAHTWEKSYSLMMTSLSLRNVSSPERLINACRWFEDIPIAQTNDLLSQEEIDQIAGVASRKAEELGHSELSIGRIAGAIRLVRAESVEQRFARLVAMVEAKFGRGVLGDEPVVHLKRAVQLRGKVAHGHFTAKDQSEFRSFSKCTLAMEALCYLLSAYDLPISNDGISRIGMNPIVRDYRNAYS